MYHGGGHFEIPTVSRSARVSVQTCVTLYGGRFASYLDSPLQISLSLYLYVGETDLMQLGKIFNTLGTPTQDSWPGLTSLPNFVEFEARDPVDLNPIFGYATITILL